MSAYEIPLTALTGEPLDPALLHGRATLVVNVASRCGLTPQKFLVSPRGEPVARFRPPILPEGAELIEAIEANLPGRAHTSG